VDAEFCGSVFKFLSTTPDGFRFSKTHEWVNMTDTNTQETTVGISEFAQNELGEVVYVELPEVGDAVTKGEAFGVVESVKAASDVYAPVSGSVTEVNSKLAEEPQLINNAPYGDGWLMKVKVDSADDVSALMDKAAYDPYCEGLSH